MTSTTEDPFTEVTVTANSTVRDDVIIATTQFTIENRIWIYTAPFILLFGVVGNVLTIVVKTKSRWRGSSTNVYFSVLAAGDLCVVVIGLIPEWLGQMGIVELWNLHPWVCRFELYLYYTALDFAIWMLVAFTCDRVIAVRFPLHKRRLCTARNAGIVSTVIFLVANLNAHVFWTRGAQYGDGGDLIGNCRWLGSYFYFESSVRPYLVLFLALIGPFLVLGASNLVILCTVKRAKKMRIVSAKGSMRNTATAQRMDRKMGQTTVMCMFTSVVFMVLVLPNIVLLIGKKAWSYDNPIYWHCRAVAGQLVYINHSINFLLYSITGSRFRKELTTLCARDGSHGYGRDSSFARSRMTRSTSASSAQIENSLSVSMETGARKNSSQYVRNTVGFSNNVFSRDKRDEKIIQI